MDGSARRRQLDFRVLGRLAVDLGPSGPEVPLGGRCQRLVLAALLREAGQAVPMGRLVTEIWGSERPATSTDPLRAPVGELRRLLGAGVLLSRAGSYVLDIERCQIDSFCFERRLGGAWAAAESGRLAEALDHIDRALGLCRGPAFGDLAVEPTLEVEAGRLDRLVLGARELRAQLLGALGLVAVAGVGAEATAASHRCAHTRRQEVVPRSLAYCPVQGQVRA